MERKEYVLSNLVFDDDFINVFNLEKDQLVILINQYYSGAFTASKLAEIYQLDTKVKNNLPKFFPRVVSEQSCQHCDEIMLGTLASKSAGKLYNELKCPACGHLANTGGWRTVRCSCTLCQKEQERAFKLAENIKQHKIELEKQRKHQNIERLMSEYQEMEQIRRLDNEKKERYLREQSQKEPVAIQTLTLQKRLYLSTLLKDCLNTSGHICLENKYQNIAPISTQSKEILDILLESRCIKVSRDSPLSSVIVFLDEDIELDFPLAYYELNVYCSDGNNATILERVISPNPYDFLKDSIFCLNMWKKISYGEALKYFLFKMRNLDYERLSNHQNIKIELVLKELLEYFSVAQVYSVIYRAVAEGIKAYDSGRAQDENHAINLIIKLCESYGKDARESSKELRSYDRDYELPESQLSRTFFDAILQIGTDGFYKVPSIQYYEESL